MDLFWLKKAVSALMAPLPAILLLLLTSIYLLRGSQGAARWARKLVTSALCLLTVFSLPPVAYLLVQPLEAAWQQQRTVPPPGPQYIAVLGSAHTNMDSKPYLGHLHTAALSRLTHGIYLARQWPDATLVLSGAALGEKVSHATTMRQAAMELGVDDSRIILLEKPRDTEEEVLALKQLVADKSLMIVSSALHLSRVQALCQQHDLQARYFPANFLVRDRSMLFDFWPSSSAMKLSELALHEYLGRLWAAIRAALR